ncbi:MAG: BamA/TamA family outer membrane protein [Gemmatimonadales bacterium]
MMAGATILMLLQAAALPLPRDTVRVVTVADRYLASGIHRFFLGDTYRRLWATPITMPVLDVARFAGGLVATDRGGSRQSRSLRFRAADGRTFSFRVLDKDPTQTWPEPLRNSPARSFAEDQISAILPAGALAVAVLEEAAGILHTGIELVVLPDDERLGQWRAEFANQPGIIEQRVRGAGDDLAAIAGAGEVVVSDELFRRLKDHGRDYVDQPRYLAARLFDLLVGDWDRHAGQWGWARFDDGDRYRWVPLPRDRDWALSRLDGLLYGLLRLYLPKYQSFSDRYGSVYGLTLSAEGLDRRLLVGLERPAWDSTAADLKARLTDEVVDRAVRALPAEYPRDAIDQLAAALKRRRDELPEVADRFYRLLAGEVELRGSASADHVAIELTDTTVAVTFADSLDRVRWRRRFVGGETKEIRLLPFGGNDRVSTTGVGGAGITLRLVDEAGDLQVDTATRRAARIYDSTRRFRPPVDPHDPLRIQRDWGRLSGFVPWFEARPEIGLLVGGGPVMTRYGFRRAPYAARIAVRAAVATAAPGVNLDLSGDFRTARPDHRFLIRATLLRTDVARYFGFGNETERSDERSFHNTRQALLSLVPAFEFPVGARGRIDLSAFLRSSDTDLDRPTLLAQERPYGSGRFTEAGARVGLTLDRRDHPKYPTSGFRAEVVARVVPALFSVTEPFGGFEARGAFFATARGLPTKPTLALRAGASRDWGRVPFFEAASIGGRGSVRGLNSHRFLGEGAVFAGGELRLDLGSFVLLVPGEFGVYGLGDIGRAFARGETSDRWHTAAGGGLWFAFLDRRSTMTVTYAASDERARWYLQAGFHF